MARSQLLRDLAGGNDLESALFRLKIIFTDLENEEINKWLDSEIEGYENVKELPPYRIIKGMAVGSYLEGGILYTNHPLPINHLKKLERDNLLSGNFKHGISSLKSLQNDAKTIGKRIPPEECYVYSSERYKFKEINVEFSNFQIEAILSKIKNKLISIIMKLEKDFEDLDSLDIFHSDTSKEVIKETEQYIINIIFDESITIGNNNKIKSSEIGHINKS